MSWDDERVKREQAIIQALRVLCDHVGTNSFTMRIKTSATPLYITLGNQSQTRQLADTMEASQ